MNNTIQLYMDEKQEIKGYPITSPDRVIDENGVNIKEKLDNKANKSDLHSHSNKNVLDGITTNKITEWDNKSNFSGNYNDLTNKPTIPEPSNYKTAYGTCSTTASTSEKAVVIDDPNWKLEIGNIIAIKPSVSNSASNVKFNVNGTGAYPLWYNNAEYTSSSTAYTGYANRTTFYIFNGTHWVWLGQSYVSSVTNASLGQGYGVCDTAESTLAKACTISSYNLSVGGIVSIKFTNAVPANSTLNIRTRGAKPIFYRGVAITNGIIKAGDIATFIYDGTNYHLISLDNAVGDVPTKTSQLTNDSGFITSIPSEYITESELNAKGYLTEHQDLSNYPKTSELTLGVHTDGLIYLFKGGKPVGIGVAQSTTILPDGDVVGYVDSNNNIVLSGNLSNGTYNLKYEMEDGSLIDVGQIVKKGSGYTNLANPTSADWKEGYRWSTSSNTPKECVGMIVTNPINCKQGDILRVKGLDLYGIVSGNSSTIHGYDNSGVMRAYCVTCYTSATSDDCVKDVVSKNGDIFTYTLFQHHDGTQKANSNLATKIYISAPYLSGYDKNNVIITLNEEIEGEAINYTNQIPLSIGSDGKPFNGGQGWKTGYRLSTSGGGETALDGTECTGFIPVTTNSTIRIKGIALPSNSTDGNFAVVGYDKSFTKLPNNGIVLGMIVGSTDNNGVTTLKPFKEYTHFSNTELAYIRVCSSNIDENSILTVDEPII